MQKRKRYAFQLRPKQPPFTSTSFDDSIVVMLTFLDIHFSCFIKGSPSGVCFWGHGLKLISSAYVEANVAAFVVDSNKKLLCLVVWDEKFKRNILDDEVTNSNEEAVQLL